MRQPLLTRIFERFDRVRYIPTLNNPLMVRHYLLFKGRDHKGKETDVDDQPKEERVHRFNAFIHQILRSDTDSFHDHPWWYFTVILWGGYWEHTPTGRFWRGPGWFAFKKATALHYLEIPEGKSCWTLFIHGKRERVWGFIDEDNSWIPHDEFNNKRVKKLWEKAIG